MRDHNRVVSESRVRTCMDRARDRAYLRSMESSQRADYRESGVSFLIIGIWWVNHHHCMKLIGRADRTFLFANIALLGCIAFLSFPTALVAEHLRDSGVRAAAITYGLMMTAAAICFMFFWFYAATGRRLIA